MNFEKACAILDIDHSNPNWKSTLKTKYRIQALKYHPDKCNLPMSTDKFQKVHDAYEFLLERNDTKPSLENLLQYFMGTTIFEDQEIYIREVIGKLLVESEFFLLTILMKMQDEQFFYIYKLINKYRRVFHFSLDFYDKMEKSNIFRLSQGKFKERLHNQVQWSDKQKLNKCDLDSTKKYDKIYDEEWNLEYYIEKTQYEEQDIETVILRPTLDDVMFNNVFQYSRNGNLYIIPLWHHELFYSNDNDTFLVQIEPKIPSSNYWIDTSNNLHQIVKFTLCELWNYVVEDKHIEVFFGKKKFNLYPNKLNLLSSQSWTWENEGISQINTENIYDISTKNDVIIHIKISGLM